MHFSDFIDFDSILIDQELMSIECGDIFKNTEQYCYHACDQKIKYSKRKQYDELFDEALLINDFVDLNYHFVQRQADKLNISFMEIKEKYYQSDKYLLCCIQIICDDANYDSDITFICLVSLETKLFITVGSRNSHPFVQTSTFGYNNSDGSGPDFEFADTAESSLSQLQTYYYKFCDNMYH